MKKYNISKFYEMFLTKLICYGFMDASLFLGRDSAAVAPQATACIDAEMNLNFQAAVGGKWGENSSLLFIKITY